MKPPNRNLGHISDVEANAIHELQRKVAAGTITNEELLRLALLQFEPGHDAFAAVETLKEVISRDAAGDLARVWLAYLCVYELMDEVALHEAVRVAEQVASADQRLKSGALWVKGAALRTLNSIDESIAALEHSVRLEPDWVANRMALANAYRDDKRHAQAIVELRTALANVERSRGIFREDDVFERFITGRASSGQTAYTINEEIARMSGKR